MVKLQSATGGPAPLLSFFPARGREPAVGRPTMLQSGRENLRHRGPGFGSAASVLQVRTRGLRGTAREPGNSARSLPGPLPMGEDGGDGRIARPGTRSFAPTIVRPGGGENQAETGPSGGEETEPEAQALTPRMGLSIHKLTRI